MLSQPVCSLPSRALPSRALLALVLLTAHLPVFGDGGVVFHDLTLDPTSGLTYQRAPSPTDADFDALKLAPTFTFDDVSISPIKSRGAPGVALLDSDRDGDLDIYVTNGPGVANSLFVNQLAETGQLSFIDIGAISGAGADDQDSTGVCFGDIDNDGDPDLYVLGNAEPNRLLENLGGNAFVDITIASGAGAGTFTTTSCSFGDVDGDGLIDLAIANAYTNWTQPLGIVAIPFDLNEPNQLFLNQGGNVFSDASATSGILDNAGFAPEDFGKPGLTWALAVYDYDLDGDADILMADDQGAVPFAGPDGVVRGILHLFENDGTGQFTDVTVSAGLDQPGGWMGIAVGDLDCNGALDFFASNFSDYPGLVGSGGAGPLGIFPSRWYLGTGAGAFTAPDLGIFTSTPFGWGAGVFDADNDGDHDIVYHGGMDLALSVDASNGGVMFRNQGKCTAEFALDTNAFPTRDHLRRNVQGMAVGDLDNDGFDDIVTAANFDIPPFAPLLPVPGNTTPFTDAAFVPTFSPTGTPGVFAFSGFFWDDGSLAVELNSGDNGNRWIQVEPLGTVGLTSDGAVNRDGIGAVLTSTTRKRRQTSSVSKPVIGGASYASQDSRVTTFGLGSARRSTVDVLWPGGTQNRLYNIRAGRRVQFPEIPCSFTGSWDNIVDYAVCVDDALDELEDAGVLRRHQSFRFFASAIVAFIDERY